MTSTVRLLAPGPREVPEEELVADVASMAGAAIEPFSPDAVSLLADLSRALFASPAARGFPELSALAFSLRRGEIARLEAAFSRGEEPGILLVPRGLAFHVAPSNVDAVLAHSFAYSLLAGNANVLRASQRASPATGVLLEALDRLLAQPGRARIRASTRIVTYGHEAGAGAALSRLADVRVLWGGDATVERLRALPTKPGTKDLVFRDRYSLAAIHAQRYLGLAEAQRRELARAFFNDAYWYNQRACSSPGLVAWCGTAGAADEAGRRFFDALQAVLGERGARAEAAAAVAKVSHAYAAMLAEPVARFEARGASLAVLGLSGLDGFRREGCGGGLFYEARVPDLPSLAPHLRARDQTLAYWGFTGQELRGLARALNGRAIDRVVPIGRALAFGRHWDGYDLLRELTKPVQVDDSGAWEDATDGG